MLSSRGACKLRSESTTDEEDVGGASGRPFKQPTRTSATPEGRLSASYIRLIRYSWTLFAPALAFYSKARGTWTPWRWSPGTRRFRESAVYRHRKRAARLLNAPAATPTAFSTPLSSPASSIASTISAVSMFAYPTKKVFRHFRLLVPRFL